MGYFSVSMWSYLEKKIRQSRLQGDYATGRRLLVMVPALAEGATLGLAETISNRCAADHGILLTLKIAQVVTESWSAGGKAKAAANKWLDEQGNLTYYRNNVSPVPGKLSLVILCGADRVTDAGGLEDFHLCDLETVWRSEMNRSFQSWARVKLHSIGIVAETAELKNFDRLLIPLLEQGRADLLQIGDWFESLDMNSAGTVRDVLKTMLGRYDAFQLPQFTGFPFGRKNATLAPYIEKANAFFAYTLFLESTARDKAGRAVEQLIESINEGLDTGIPLDEENVRGPYQTGLEFLEGLDNYIQTEDRDDRERLQQCDFVTVMDKVLKFRKKTEKAKKEGMRKLSGSPIEVVLHALWQTFREFYRDRRFANAQVQRIEIVCDQFKHDYESASEFTDTTSDRNELARQYLMRLLGGVDHLISSRVGVPREDGELTPVACKLADDDVACVYSKTAEPLLEFSIHIMHDAGEEPHRQRFAWRLPEIQPYRLAESLLQWANDALADRDDIWKLPVFHLPYYEEVLRATDDEEIRRVMLHCIRDAHPDDVTWTNLLSHEWVGSNDSLLPFLKPLADSYRQFLGAAHDRGLHAALFDDKWQELRRAYAAACEQVVNTDGANESLMTAMLMKCFLVVQRRDPELGSAWCTEPFESSGVVTVLHPALLEMLEAQILFLCSCFNAAVTSELKREEKSRSFAEKLWNGYADYASIQSPLSGLLYNPNKNLDTNVRGQDLIHRIGMPENAEATLSTRLLLRYDNSSDDDTVTDAEMFAESRESRLLFRLMMDYFRLHPHARDGLTLAVFRNQDIQPVIAAIHQYLMKLADPKDRRYYVLLPERRKPYAIAVTIFSESGDDVDVARWIEQWRERWEAAETETKFQAYTRCRFSVAHRIVDTQAQRLGSFQRLISDSFEADMVILHDFIGAGQSGNTIVEVAPFDITTRTLKFPILEKPCCAVIDPANSSKRSRVVSNLQFKLGTLHTQVMNRLQHPGMQSGKQYVVLGVGDYSRWRGVVNALHAKTEWVVCIDPNMDERLIRVPAGEADREREIIGFGSGVGAHGEANFTISTEQFSLSDVCVLLAASVRETYSSQHWTEDECQSIAKSVLKEARELSGLSLVRATGVGYYIRDFMAYSLTRKMLQEEKPLLCDHLISLDAYRHWFDMADSERRPDLMWLTARMDDNNRLRLNVRLIECKMGNESEAHLVRARTQITNGLQVLIPAFAPRSQSHELSSEDNRPDERYWWLQLHRVIASRAEIEKSQEKAVLSALERLAEGDYEITWGAAIFAFWNDSTAEAPLRIGQWTVSDTEDVRADIYVMGSEFVRKLALDGTGFPVTWGKWAAMASPSTGNVCDVLDDVELPPGEDEDDDLPSWNEEDEKEENGEDYFGMDESQSDQEPDRDNDLITEPESSPEPETSSQSQTNVPSDELAPPSTDLSTPSQTDMQEGACVEVIRQPIPARILLGKTVGGNKPVYWEFGHEDVANRHMLIFGTSGMGKTYAIQCLLSELGRQGQNSLIIDYTDGFIPSKLEAETAACLNPAQHFIQQAPLPISPFKAQVSYEAGMEFRDTSIAIAKRVASVFKSVYELGNQQFPVLIDAITEGLDKHGDSFTLAGLLKILQGYLDDTVHATGTVRTTTSKLKPFIQSNPFSTSQDGIGWQSLYSDEISRCHVFQFFKVDKHSARALVEFVLWDLYAFVSSFGNKETPRVVVLDEVQNLDLGPDAPVAKYLTEGRKHGLSLITATQTVRGVGGVNDARVSRLFQAEHKLFFKPTENEMREHAQLMHNAISNVTAQEWSTRLASLQKGECWSLGRSLNEATGKLVFQAQRVKITSLEDRGFHV